MKTQKLSYKLGAFALSCLLSLSFITAARAATEKPQPLAVGTTGHISLEKDQKKDYSVSLKKGSYQVILDGKHPDGEPTYIVAKVMLLKPNGVIINDKVTEIRDRVVGDRVGAIISAPKPFVARFRLMNEHEQSGEFWFTVVPVSSTKRVPFGWNAPVTPARISSDNGVGGEISPYQVFYHSITLPKGKWSISLGLSHTDKEKQDDYLVGLIDLLNSRGVTTQTKFVEVRERGTQARKEGILSITKPTTYLLRVRSDLGSEKLKYDVTIAPADE